MDDVQLNIWAPGLSRSMDLMQRNKHEFKWFNRFLRWAQKKEIPYNPNTLIFQLMLHEIPASLPIATLTALADDLPQSPAWLRADPIGLQIDLAHVYQLGNQHLFLSNPEIVELHELINPLLKNYSLSLEVPNASRFYMACNKQPRIITHNPEEIIGKSIIDYLPHGEEADFWLRLFTEIQMLLHHSAFNQRRIQENKPTVDALWFWGVGELPKKTFSSPYAMVFSDEPLVTGLAKALHFPYQCLSDNLTEVLSTLKIGENYLIATQQFSQLEHAEKSPQEIQQKFFYPLVQALREKKITKFLLYPGDKHCYHVATKFHWKFW